jgi:uncharacterized BrkB/YihY/UPF0761 family membrane protein
MDQQSISGTSAPVTGDGGTDESGVGAAKHSVSGRVAASRERVAKASAASVGRLERARKRNPHVDALLLAIERDNATAGGVLASAVAFRVFLFIVPMVVWVVLILNAGTGSGSARAIKSRGIAGIIAKTVGESPTTSLLHRIVSILVVSFFMFIAARTLFKVLRTIFALQWGVPVKKVKSIRPAFAVLALTLIAFGFGALVSRLREYSLPLGLVAAIVYFVIPAGLWLLASWYLPHDEKAPWWALVPGAIALGVGVVVLQIVTVYYLVDEVQRKSQLYGTLGTALTLLLWAYLLGRVLVFSGVLNATLWQRREHQPPPPMPGPVEL